MFFKCLKVTKPLLLNSFTITKKGFVNNCKYILTKLVVVFFNYNDFKEREILKFVY